MTLSPKAYWKQNVESKKFPEVKQEGHKFIKLTRVNQDWRKRVTGSGVSKI